MITVNQADGSQVELLKDNAALKAKLAEYNIAKKDFITIKGVEHDLNAYIHMSNFMAP